MSNDVSALKQNSEKLDEILVLLKGSGPDVPGLIQRVAIIERALFGKENSGGLLATVAELKKWNNWVMGTASAGAGAVGLAVLQYVMKHL